MENLVDYTKEYYEDNGQNQDRLGLKFFSNILKKYFKSGLILDYGCGTGFFLKKFNDSLYEKFGYEISDYGKVKTIANNPEVKIISDIKVGVKNNSLDAISCLHVLEHIARPEEVVNIFNEKLKSGGVLFLVVPNYKSLGRVLKKGNWFAFGDKTHISLLGDEEWLNIIKASNFRIISKGVDGLWDVPYLKFVPNFIQKLIFYPTAALQILFNSLFLPLSLGEDLIVVAKKI